MKLRKSEKVAKMWSHEMMTNKKSIVKKPKSHYPGSGNVNPISASAAWLHVSEDDMECKTLILQ